METKNYKYLIINTNNNELTIKKSLRDITGYINEIYPKQTTSYNTINRRLKDKNNFKYFELLIMELKWE